MNNDFYHSRELVEQYIKLADGYDGAELIKKLNQFLPNDSSILELGTGPGTDLKLLSYKN